MKKPLKIALVLETSGGGSGRHVLDLARGLVRHGQEVTVIWAPDRADTSFVEALEQEDGVATLSLSMKRSVGPGDIKSLRNLHTLLKSHEPFDVLHGHSSKAGALLRLLPRSVKGARIYTPHAFRTMDPELGQPQRLIYSTIERVLAPRTHRIIVVSRVEHDHATSIGISPKRMTKVVNGATLPAEATRTAARKALGLRDDDVAVGFVGRLEDQKDPLRFVKAVSDAVTQAPSLKGIVLGDGSLRNEAERMATSGSVQFMGWQDGPRLMPGLDVFCMTSRYEAMPYTLLEALHANVPIVTTDVGGAAESVLENETGHVLPLESAPKDISKVLQDLARDHTRRKAFGAASKALAQDRTIDVMVKETLAVYRDALGPAH